MSQETILQFLETKRLPKKITVERTQQSKYQFYCVVRQYRLGLNLKPKFFTYSKQEMNAVKSMMEEHSIFEDKSLYVLEGYSMKFVEEVSLPEGNYLVAETDNGELKAEAYSYRLKRDALKVLTAQMGLKLSLRALLSLDWSGCRDLADFEVILRKAKVMGWTEEEIGLQLKGMEGGQILPHLKRSQFKEILNLLERYGAQWFQNHLTELLAQIAHYKALRSMGFDEEKAGKDLDVGYGRVKELEEASKLLTDDDLKRMIERLVSFDRLTDRNRQLGLELLLFNAPIRIKK